MPFRRASISLEYGGSAALGKISAAMVIILFGLLLATDAKSQPVTIAVLGDSLVQGYGLQPNQGFVPQMQRWLDTNGAEVKLINAGVSGDTTAGGLARVEWTLSPDIQALVVSLGGNDVLRGIDPSVSRANLDEILRIASAHSIPILLVGTSAPLNFGSDYAMNFEAIYPDLSAKHDTQLYPNFFEVLIALPDRQAVLRDYFQGDGIHPNAQGISLIVADLGQYFANLAASTRN